MRFAAEGVLLDIGCGYYSTRDRYGIRRRPGKRAGKIKVELRFVSVDLHMLASMAEAC